MSEFGILDLIVIEWLKAHRDELLSNGIEDAPAPMRDWLHTRAASARFCTWPGCNALLTFCGRGRPPKYCPDHAKASKVKSDRARPHGGHTSRVYPQCCKDARKENERVRVCPQHREWSVIVRGRIAVARADRLQAADERISQFESREQYGDIEAINGGFSFKERKSFNRPIKEPAKQCELGWSRNPTYPKKSGHRLPPCWSGLIGELDRKARAYLARNKALRTGGTEHTLAA
jgi:hypothetical protein